MNIKRKNGLLSAYGFYCGYFQRILDTGSKKIQVEMNLSGIFEVKISFWTGNGLITSEYIFGFNLLNSAYKAANILKNSKEFDFERAKMIFEKIKGYEGACVAVERGF